MKKWIAVWFVCLFASGASADVLKIATIAPEGSAWMKGMRDTAAEIKRRTDGRVEIKYFGGGIQGSDATVLRKMRIGALHGGAFTPSALHTRYGGVSVYGLPLVFDSTDEANYVRERMDAEIIQGLYEAGYVCFGFAATGFAVIMSTDPVRNAEDLKGKKVWVPEGDPVSYATMEAVDLNPQTLPLTDVLVGLQTKLIDIVPVSPIGALVLQWHTRVKYMTDLPLVYTMGFMVIDKRAFNKIAKEDQAIIREVMSDAYASFDKINVEDDAAAKEALIKSGIQLVKPDGTEKDELRQALASSNVALAQKGEFPMALLTQMMGHIEDYRRQQVADE